jgi:hypothetical protein
MIASILRRLSQYWRDAVIVVVLAATAGFVSYWSAQLIDPALYHVYDQWFESDTKRVVQNMTDRWSNHYRTRVHPLFSLVAFPPVYALREITGTQPITAVKIVIAVVASLWVGTLFAVLRLIGCRQFDTVLFCVLAMASASAIFWFAVPDTYPFGSLSILLAFSVVALAQHRTLSHWWYVGVSAATLSFTLTNWMVGILATFVQYRWKRALQLTANAFCLVVLLWAVQKVAFPSAHFFLDNRDEAKFSRTAGSGGLQHVLSSFVFHTMAMPAIREFDLEKYDLEDQWPTIMLTQMSLPGSGSFWGVVAVVLWSALLGLGIWALLTVEPHPRLRVVLGLSLLGQFALHAVYGDETFLYALHFGPLLVILAAFSTLTRARVLGLVLAGTLAICAGINNGLQFSTALRLMERHSPPRNQVLAQMRQRPADPWPRGVGHVILAAPGSREVDKTYHEPGGSLSPTVGSFGVSLWMTDSAGNLQATSDTIPLSDLQQQLVWTNDQKLPTLLTETPYYQARWSATGEGHWTLNLKTQANSSTNPMVVIRSVGPAGGPVNSLAWDNLRLLINDRWSIHIDPTPLKVHLGEEGPQGWMTSPSPLTRWQGNGGWGYVRFELGVASNWKVIIKDTHARPMAGLNTLEVRPTLSLDLPDTRFSASLHTQIAHLLMSLVDRQTRPGEPMNYPLAWLRDGAYVMVALARAGQLEVARELSSAFAENDFFGGFGPEADAPGLAIWALEEVAVRVNQPAYDRWLWPHVRRKAEFILEMLSTERPLYRPVTGPIVPKQIRRKDLSLVAEPARDGLIIGRMDFHRPLLFVNAVSYRGLLDAAALAGRVDRPTDAERWRAKAAELKRAWQKAFKPPESSNPRTYSSGLWPTWVADSDRFLQGLQERWVERRDTQGGFRRLPSWTYFEIAEAHQWLLLDHTDRVWTTLHWFWDHQASPGLYTWWEGKGEENTFHRWEGVRGWVRPPHVTPHYRTAAEMLLLQLDMLAYANRSIGEATVVIGAGIPMEWLNQPMHVKGMTVPGGQLDWSWDGKHIHIKMRGNTKIHVQLGSAFPADTPLHIKYF